LKSNIWALVVCVMLTLSLASCGEQKNAAGSTANKPQSGTVTSPEDSDASDKTDNGIVTGDNADETEVMGDSAVKDLASADKKVASKTETHVQNSRSTGQNSVSWNRMLQNGHVHDTDGDLTDNENSRWQ